jgi:hypothetical protein
MKLNDHLQEELKKSYQPSSLITKRYKGNDIVFKTDEDGYPVLLFIGLMNERGWVKGQRYSRTLKIDHTGRIIKDHWELKGKSI